MSRGVAAVLVAMIVLQICLELFRQQPNSSSSAVVSTTCMRDNPVEEAPTTATCRHDAEKSVVVATAVPLVAPPLKAAIDVDPRRNTSLLDPLLDFKLYNQYPEFELPFDLSECKFVYLDLGVNEGWQIEKLFLGAKPKSPWARQFAKHFSPQASKRRKEVCCIGAEPDLNHKQTLDTLEKNLTRMGVRVKIFRHPIWVNNDVMTFNSLFDPVNRHWGSTLSKTGLGKNPNVTQVKIRAIRLATLLSLIDPQAVVLSKLDIEGAEHRVLTDIVLTGTICRINFFGIEVHEKMTSDRTALSSIKRLATILERSQECKTKAVLFDDES